jgi:hypothetical protein
MLKMAENKINKTCAFVIGSIAFIAVTGLLIYLCLYLTQYTPPNDSTILTSTTNHSRIALSNSSKLLNIITNTVNDDDDDIISEADAVIPILKKALIATLTNATVTSLTKVEVPSLTKVEVPSLTRVIVPSKARNEVTYTPETITLQNVNE